MTNPNREPFTELELMRMGIWKDAYIECIQHLRSKPRTFPHAFASDHAQYAVQMFNAAYGRGTFEDDHKFTRLTLGNLF